MTPTTQRRFANACLARSMVLTGSYVALSKPLVAALPVFLLAWLRFGIAAVAMLPWLRKPADGRKYCGQPESEHRYFGKPRHLPRRRI